MKKHPIPVMPYEDDAWTAYILSYANMICYLDDFSYEWNKCVLKNSSLSVRLLNRSVQEKYVDIRRAILFSMDNGNPQRMALLKKAAKVKVSQWEGAYHYEEYEKLRDEIEKNY